MGLWDTGSYVFSFPSTDPFYVYMKAYRVYIHRTSGPQLFGSISQISDNIRKNLFKVMMQSKLWEEKACVCLVIWVSLNT